MLHSEVIARSLNDSSEEPFLENTTVDVEVANLDLFMLQLDREEGFLESCIENVPAFAAEFALNPPEYVDATGGFQDNYTQISFLAARMARDDGSDNSNDLRGRGGQGSLLQQSPSSGALSVAKCRCVLLTF